MFKFAAILVNYLRSEHAKILLRPHPQMHMSLLLTTRHSPLCCAWSLLVLETSSKFNDDLISVKILNTFAGAPIMWKKLFTLIIFANSVAGIHFKDVQVRIIHCIKMQLTVRTSNGNSFLRTLTMLLHARLKHRLQTICLRLNLPWGYATKNPVQPTPRSTSNSQKCRSFRKWF